MPMQHPATAGRSRNSRTRGCPCTMQNYKRRGRRLCFHAGHAAMERRDPSAGASLARRCFCVSPVHDRQDHARRFTGRRCASGSSAARCSSHPQARRPRLSYDEPRPQDVHRFSRMDSLREIRASRAPVKLGLCKALRTSRRAPAANRDACRSVRFASSTAGNGSSTPYLRPPGRRVSELHGALSQVSAIPRSTRRWSRSAAPMGVRRGLDGQLLGLRRNSPDSCFA